MFIHITLVGSKFSSATLPTVHSIYVYTDIYDGLKIFANSCIYMYIYMGFYSICLATLSTSLSPPILEVKWYLNGISCEAFP